MPDADAALRAEIEKVRDRARLQALAQGDSTDEADRRGQKAVDDFCGKWGIRPEMVSTPKEPRVPAAPVRTVDLGSSPLRTSSNPSATQAMRISDLLKRGREASSPGAAAASAAAAAAAAHAQPAAAHPAPAAGGKSSLAGLLDRVRSNSLVEVPSVSPAPAKAAAAPPKPAPPAPPRPTPAAPAPAPARSATPPSRIQPTPAPAHGAPLTADRRKALLEEFDRTYTEVQSMIEARIGVADVAMGDAPRGLASAFERVAKGGVSESEAKVLSGDVQRLRDHLKQMTSICDEFLSHLDEFVERRSGSARP